MDDEVRESSQKVKTSTKSNVGMGKDANVAEVKLKAEAKWLRALAAQKRKKAELDASLAAQEKNEKEIFHYPLMLHLL